MKVVCIENSEVYSDEDDYEYQIHMNIISTDRFNRRADTLLILGKTYNVISVDKDFTNKYEYLNIIDESGCEFWYNSIRFIPLEKHRENKFNQLGI